MRETYLPLRSRLVEQTTQTFNAMQIGIALLTLAALAFLIGAVKSTLLGAPHMHVVGNGSSEFELN